MLQLREFTGSDLTLAEAQLHKAHVRKQYEIPQLDVTLEDWMVEYKERNEKYQWIIHLIIMWQEEPIGLCQYYKATDSEEDFGTLPRIGTYGIDYLIDEEDCIGKGLGKNILELLVNRIFSFLDVYRVTADIDRGDHASEKTLLSCDSTLQNPVKNRYILLKSEFIETSQRTGYRNGFFSDCDIAAAAVVETSCDKEDAYEAHRFFWCISRPQTLSRGYGKHICAMRGE